MDTLKLLQDYDCNGVLGELTGVEPRAQEAFFRQALASLRRELEQAQKQAARTGQPRSCDASRLSGTNGGDNLVVHPDGRVERRLDTFPALEQLLTSSPERPAGLMPCSSLAEARPLLLRCAYNGLWSPSGTNWQPVHTVELSSEWLSRLAGRALAGCGLAVLAPPRYQSILSDIASLAGLDPAARAEWIDTGIWLQVARLSAACRGWWLQEHLPVGEPDPGTVLARILPLDSPLREQLASGQLRLCCLLECWKGEELASGRDGPGGLAPSELDHLVEARSTQRVASPAGELDADVLRGLWNEASRACAADSQIVSLEIFTWHDEFTADVGRMMNQGLERLLSLLDEQAIGRQLARRHNLPDPPRGALPVAMVPPHLCARLEQQGLYRRDGKWLVDRRGRPLDCRRLAQLVRLVTASFGRYFLRFRNTHPLLGVLCLAPSARDETGFRLAGRLVALLGLLARSRGLVSIIKSGPLEIAGEAIAARLAAEQRLRSGWLPVLTFQLGLPLGPTERVGAGERDEHDGLAERLLDKRSGRVPLRERYFLSPERC